MPKTILEDTSAEIIVKKSKFIANLFYISSIEEVEIKLKEIKKKYYDAKHHCYAYSIMTNNGNINKMSDDGEPSGTAGAPMLNIINKNGLVNVLIVVTRYFGGVLLGTGGLVKAYSDATLNAIEKAKIINEQNGYEAEIILDYSELERFTYFCQKNEITIIKIDYDEKIKCNIEINEEEKDKIFNIKKEKSIKIENIKIIKEKNIRKNTEI